MEITADIVERARRGDRAAMHQIYEQTVRYIGSVCSRYLGSDDDVRDTLQETYITAFGSLDKFEFRGQSSVRSWITRIAVAKSVDLIRSRSKMITVDISGAENEVEETPDISSISQQDIMKAIRELPEGYRTVLNLYVFENKSHKEISQMLGISEGTSASQYHRAKSALAAALGRKHK